MKGRRSVVSENNGEGPTSSRIWGGGHIMSGIETVRASVEKKLEALEHQAEALEAQLTQTREQVLERVEEGKRQLRELVTSVRNELSASPGVVDQVKAELQTALDHLQVQLALGKAEARDVLEEQREKILQALRHFESSADRTLTGAAFRSGRLWEDLDERASRLEAEFEAVRHGWLDERGAQRHMVEATQQELLGRLRAYRDDLRVKRQMVRARADTFEIDLREGLAQIKTAFRRLFE